LNRVAQVSDEVGRPVIATTLIFSTPTQTDAFSRHPNIVLAPVLSDALGGLALWFGIGPPEPLKSPSSRTFGDAQWGNEYEVKTKLTRAGVATPKSWWLPFAQRDQTSRATPTSWPVVVKGVDRTIYHKSRLGLVQVGVDSAPRLKKAIGTISRLAKLNGYSIEGFLIEEMVGEGIDFAFGIEKQQIGSVLMLGLGGGEVELAALVRFAVLPVTHMRIDQMLSSIGLGDALQIRRVRQTVNRLVAFYAAADLASLECNPVRLLKSGEVIVLDAVAIKKPPQAANQ
jgi:succinyl-CoA synthetase beta subunit